MKLKMSDLKKIIENTLNEEPGAPVSQPTTNLGRQQPMQSPAKTPVQHNTAQQGQQQQTQQLKQQVQQAVNIIPWQQVTQGLTSLQTIIGQTDQANANNVAKSYHALLNAIRAATTKHGVKF
ncbi:MAG: hypothetical protein Q7K43_00885 [Candidatus Woesearchaeota archaeon]|nr:hypothetical protein [Candidatus Woesearchaeota archaeon]